MNRVNSQVKLNGKPEKQAVSVHLRAGALTLESEMGTLRNICFDGKEVIRMIYPAVRDDNWLTVEPEISSINLVRQKRSFHIRYVSLYRFKDIHFRATFTFTGTEDSRLTLEMKGEALSNFRKNRIGFCVLHPVIPCAGRECRIDHPDGTFTVSSFPQAISPWQPFRNIAGMHWKLDESHTALLHFEGDIFETEDQRNWTDASYKTYSTPLDIPYPVLVKAGTNLYQHVEFEVRGMYRTKVRKYGVVLTVGRESPRQLPCIGIGATTQDLSINRQEGEAINRLGFSHLRAELYLFRNDVASQLARIHQESSFTGLQVELCLFFGQNPLAEYITFLRHYRKNDLQLKSLLVLDANWQVTPTGLLHLVLPAVRKEFRTVPVGAGTNCNFAQLNRCRPDPGLVDFLCFSVHPQEHASDNRSLMENTEAQRYVVESALLFAGNKPVFVSPVTLQRRFNANTSNYESPVYDGHFPPQVDARQMSLFGAAWTVGSLKYLLDAGAESLTYYETVGERGIMMGDRDSSWPLQFPAIKGMVFPVFHVFRMLQGNKAYRIVNLSSNRPFQVDGFALANDQKGLLFLSNMTNRNQVVACKGLENYRVMFNMYTGNFDRITRHRMTDELNKTGPISSGMVPLEIRPYETLVLEFPMDQHRF